MGSGQSVGWLARVSGILGCVVAGEEVEGAVAGRVVYDGIMRLGMSPGCVKSLVPSLPASAIASQIILSPNVLYYETRHNIRTLDFRNLLRKARRWACGPAHNH